MATFGPGPTPLGERDAKAVSPAHIMGAAAMEGMGRDGEGDLFMRADLVCVAASGHDAASLV